jgi:hypothetical protein
MITAAIAASSAREILWLYLLRLLVSRNGICLSKGGALFGAKRQETLQGRSMELGWHNK